MSHAEHHPERDTEENEPINFEWTPELVKIGTSRDDIHPPRLGYQDCTYRPGMILPDPADTRECLRWVGLSDKKIIEVERKFNELYPDFQAPSCEYDNKVSTKGFSDITFPLIEGMVDLFMEGELWFTIKSPHSAIDETIIPFWMELKEFVRTKLLYEGKAWSNYGRWVVREGETLDQAKARVDDRERQRLKEEAIKEHKAMLELQQQRRDREEAEDIARWAEEDRVEAEMLKQQSSNPVEQKDEE
ncbi:hypothetical protein N7536_011874 [Penicillium majusculum]|nr:hypothetical protein N7536_011874 [Penicillium majusculum]